MALQGIGPAGNELTFEVQVEPSSTITGKTIHQLAALVRIRLVVNLAHREINDLTLTITGLSRTEPWKALGATKLKHSDSLIIW